MVNCQEVRTCYNNLYKEYRRYIWGIREVAALVDLELASYETCLDVAQVKQKLNNLKVLTESVIRQDDDLKKAVDAFEAKLEDETMSYSNLYRVTEVLQV